MLGWQRASIANGKSGETDWVAFDAWAARSGILTPPLENTYVMAFPDLRATGPLVLEYPPGGLVGILMDYWMVRPTSRSAILPVRGGRTRPLRHTE